LLTFDISKQSFIGDKCNGSTASEKTDVCIVRNSIFLKIWRRSLGVTNKKSNEFTGGSANLPI
jgi:hypothetical protein